MITTYMRILQHHYSVDTWVGTATTLAVCNAICQEAENKKRRMEGVGEPKVLLVSNFPKELEVDVKDTFLTCSDVTANE